MSNTKRSLIQASYLSCVATMIVAAAPAQSAVTMADSPLFLTVAVAPNITVTLDDSGSMARAYVPEICNGDSSNRCNLLDTSRYAKSSHYNLLHYNPEVTYPVAKDATGADLETSFTAAARSGFDSALGTVDLSTNYRPTAFMDLPYGGNRNEGYMRHSGDDVRCNNSGSPRMCQVLNPSSGVWDNTTQACSGDNNTARNNYCRDQGIPAYYYKYDASNTGCTGTDAQRAESNACYDRVVVSSTSGPGGTDEQQNFANWFSFARTRNLATQTAASLAFATIDPDVRVAWQALNTCRGSSNSLVTTNCQGWRRNHDDVSNAINTFTGTHKQNFYNWLFQLPTDNSTPLPTSMRRVGQYYSLNTGATSPYNDEPGVDGSSQLVCRRNYHVMMTDGIWNTAYDIGGNRDGASNVPLPETVLGVSSYSARDPYSDDWDNTLADVAFSYWASDLSLLGNELLPSIKDPTGTESQRFWNPRNDPAIWQHMVNFTIGLGLSGFLEEAGLTWTGNMYGGSYTGIEANTEQWPQAYSNSNNAANVADLWHAAINSRGQFFSADDPSSLSVAFRAALTAITADSGSSAALSANSTSLTGTTLVYQAKFNQDWSGTLLALPVDPTTGVVSTTPAWDASTLIPAHGSRQIFTHNGTDGVEFDTCSNLSTDQQDALNRTSGGTLDDNCEARLQWLRGNPKDEVRSTTSGSLNLFRNRPTNVMGDIINSDPAYVKDVDYGYSGLPVGTPGQDSYAAYRAANGLRPAMVYVGSNDGKVYGIRGDQGDADSGKEVFSYIPGGVFHNLSHLTDPSYSHRYYADGSIIVRDAYIDGEWRTILVGGLNAGGRSIYALDVTDPMSFSEDDVLWEFDAGDDPDLGLTFSRPQIGILENGQWVAVFGNGYNSTGGALDGGGSYLFVVDLADGTLLSKLRARDVVGDESNGLSTPILIDKDSNGMIDTAYAGDLRGNLWKFNLGGADAASWNVANNVPLFRGVYGGVGQPITAQPKVAGHPSSGRLILFGTGRYLTNSDVFDMNRQSYYGIWDNDTFTTRALRADLQEQTFDLQEEASGRVVRSVSGETVNWGTQRGWYIDLLDGSSGDSEIGERVVNTSLVIRDMVLFSSIIPSTDPCDPGGTSWLVALKVDTGGSFNRALFDLDGDGEFDSIVEDDAGEDQYVNALRTDRLGISNVPVLIVEDNTPDDPNDDPVASADIAFAISTGTSGETETNKVCLRLEGCNESEEPPPTSQPVRRRSWIQIR